MKMLEGVQLFRCVRFIKVFIGFFTMMRGASRHLDVSPVPLGLKGAHDPCVEWSVTTVNRRAEAQPALGKPTKT